MNWSSEASPTNSRRLEYTSRPPSQKPIYHGLQFAGSESSLRNFWYSLAHAPHSRFPRSVSRAVGAWLPYENCFALMQKDRTFAPTELLVGLSWRGYQAP